MKMVFFKTPKPKRFSFPTRYYDEEKEYWEHRKRELGIGEKANKEDFKSRMGSEWGRMRNLNASKKKKANMSVIIYFAIVALIAYLFFFR
ncbi:MAG: hypothetical protein DRJ05_01480 [Bacteroidetes bacterium]|nr:MAG: hypothetical protein DRJ05_01480 [Bacteroidota bacterium]